MNNSNSNDSLKNKQQQQPPSLSYQKQIKTLFVITIITTTITII
jgi:hypothetical protein